jgi:hypothetical protein
VVLLVGNQPRPDYDRTVPASLLEVQTARSFCARGSLGDHHTICNFDYSKEIRRLGVLLGPLAQRSRTHLHVPLLVPRTWWGVRAVSQKVHQVRLEELRNEKADICAQVFWLLYDICHPVYSDNWNSSSSKYW